MNILEDFVSKDSHKIWQASCKVANSFNLEELKELSNHLNEILQSTKGIELGGAFCPNSYHLEFAIKKLEHVKNDLGCLCNLYPNNMFYNPEKEQSSKNIEIDDTVRIEGKWIDYYLCHCVLCNSKFKVKEREGHFTWWSWKKA